jgi:glutamine cyclotransferase
MKSPINVKMSQRTRWIIYIAIAVIALILVLRGRRTGPGNQPGSSNLPVDTYSIVAEFPHDPDAFTEGLAYSNGLIYEGTGLYGRSSVRKVALESGQILEIRRLPEKYFGEGIALRRDSLYQLTLDAQTLFIYDKQTLDPRGELHYPTHGWGLTYDGRDFIMGDGTSTLYFMEPRSFTRTRQIIVKDGNRPVIGLNELEYVKGEIYANVWRTNFIARISPRSGKVLGWIDLTGILSPVWWSDSTGVLNGIAYDPAGDRLFVTGKNWPRLFQIDVVRE